MEFQIGTKMVGDNHPTFIIAEIGSNFNHSLEKAKELVDLAIEAGADAVKFQSFIAEKIICKEAFENLSMAFQAKWKKKVWDVYREAEFPRDWHKELMVYCKKKGIVFFSSPYDHDAVDLLDEIGCDCFKLGSGEISNYEFLEYVASKNKPLILGCGATNLAEIEDAVKAIRKTGNTKIALLQCITNYPSPIDQANLNVMKTLKSAFQTIIGYSDHSLGEIVVTSAVALEAKIIEKHFTFDKKSNGPDHPHAMDFQEFKDMVVHIRQVEAAMGSSEKFVVETEKETVFLQRRSLFAAMDIPAQSIITEKMVSILRTPSRLLPKYKKDILGLKVSRDVKKGDPIIWEIFK